MCQCIICNKVVNEDNSIGRDCLLVCNKCADNLSVLLKMKPSDIYRVILKMGFLKEGYMKEEAIKTEKRKWEHYLILDELAAKSRGLI